MSVNYNPDSESAIGHFGFLKFIDNSCTLVVIEFLYLIKPKAILSSHIRYY